jgi:hypothetical protein
VPTDPSNAWALHISRKTFATAVNGFRASQQGTKRPLRVAAGVSNNS